MRNGSTTLAIGAVGGRLPRTAKFVSDQQVRKVRKGDQVVVADEKLLEPQCSQRCGDTELNNQKSRAKGEAMEESTRKGEGGGPGVDGCALDCTCT